MYTFDFYVSLIRRIRLPLVSLAAVVCFSLLFVFTKIGAEESMPPAAQQGLLIRLEQSAAEAFAFTPATHLQVIGGRRDVQPADGGSGDTASSFADSGAVNGNEKARLDQSIKSVEDEIKRTEEFLQQQKKKK